MANHARGEVALKIDGKPRTLALTMGAIAEIEDELGIGIAEIGNAIQQGRMKPLLVVLYWMLKAGGWDDLTPDDRLTLQVDLKAASKAIEAAFAAMSPDDDDADEAPAAGNA